MSSQAALVFEVLFTPVTSPQMRDVLETQKAIDEIVTHLKGPKAPTSLKGLAVHLDSVKEEIRHRNMLNLVS